MSKLWVCAILATLAFALNGCSKEDKVTEGPPKGAAIDNNSPAAQSAPGVPPMGPGGGGMQVPSGPKKGRP
jgi:hypothetical protein